MLYSILAFLMTLLEASTVAAGFITQNQAVFYNTVYYGSPFYILQHAVGPFSILHENNPVIIALAIFHLVKYFIIFEAQRREDRNVIRTIALLLEACYLGLSTYYLL